MTSLDSSLDLGFIKNVDVIQRFLDLTEKTVLDSGCGNLTFSRILAELGAQVIAIDPDQVQAEINRQTELPSSIEFIESGAEKIPLPNRSLDGVFFSYSLHHIPKSIYPAVFKEVRRVLKPDGFLYILEPTDCPWNQVMKLFHDEDQERADAQAAILELAAPHFESARVVTYHDIKQYDSFDDFAAQFASKSFNALYSEADVRAPVVEQAFEELSGPDYSFESPKKVVLLQNLKP